MQNKHKEALQKSLIMILITVVSVGLDQLSKQWAIDNLKGGPVRYYFNGLLQFLYATNEGAFGSLGSNLAPTVRFWVLTVAPIAFLVGFAVHVLLNSQYSKYELWAFSFLVGGGVGNLIDRARFQYVVDFMYIGTGKIGTNIFNIADMIIVTGFVMIALRWIKTSAQRKPTIEDPKKASSV